MGNKNLWSSVDLGFMGYGGHLPGAPILNPSVSEDALNSTDLAIMGAIDVASRHVSDPEENIVDLAIPAVRKALKDAELEVDEIDLMIMSNWTDRQFVPESAPLLAARLGIPKVFSFNVCGACTGFVHAIHTAAALMNANSALRHALIVSVDQFSRRVRPTSKGELIVGDGAGVVVMGRTESTSSNLIDSVMFSDGSKHELVTAQQPHGWIRSMKALKDHAVAAHVDVVEKLFAQNDLQMSDIDWVVPHPGTAALHTAIRHALSVCEEKFVTNFEKIGNTGSASIPLVLAEMKQDGRLQAGDLVLSTTVGSGWYYGGMVFYA